MTSTPHDDPGMAAGRDGSASTFKVRLTTR